MEKLVLIDGNSLINRAFYATPILTTKTGTYTNAVFAFVNMLLKLSSDVKPDYMAVAFDLKAPTFRHKMYKEYKGTRKPMPDELRKQIPLLKEVLHLMNITMFEQEGIEADDIIGTIAKHADTKTYIVTGDKDSFQLVDDRVSVMYTKRGISNIEEYNAENFASLTGLTPPQIIDYKALAGDDSDNIPGIKGIGAKTAITLLQKYGDLDNIYAHTDELSLSVQNKFALGKEYAYLSRTLATINTDCDVDTDVNKMRFVTPFPYAVRKKFIALEFKALSAKTALYTEPEKEELYTPTTNKEATIKNVESLSDFDAENIAGDCYFIADARRADLYVGDTEYLFKIKETLLDDGFNLSDVLRALKPIFNGKNKLTAYDKKDLMHKLRTVDISLTCECDDVSVMKYLADFTGRDEPLSAVIEEYDKNPATPAFSLYEISEYLRDKLEKEGMTKLYRDLELPLAEVLFDMETAGFKVDYDALNAAGQKFRERMQELERQIKELAGESEFNLNSPVQLGEILFEKLKIGKAKKTKRGYSTSAEVLEELKDAHPVVPLILSYRRIQKLNSTYVEGLKPLIDRNTGLIYTSFNQTVTSTGRLSSKEPNLQNIPVRDDEGRELRKFFVPRDKDHVLVSADYSQIELRLLAAFSGCKGLISAFDKGEDVHAETAAKVFGIKEEEVTPEMRRAAKAVNFGIIYGISEYGLSKNLGVPVSVAKNYIAGYFREYPEVKKYMAENVEFARRHGYSVTLLGRKRYIKEINSDNYNLRTFGERAAMNMPLQGSSADIIKLAMLGVSRRLKDSGMKSVLILQVHDELIVDALISEAEEVKKILVEEMEGAVKLRVALTVELGAGETWYDAK